MIAMIVSDVAFDLLSVFAFRGGMFGIALASGLSYLLSLAACCGFFLSKDCIFRFSLRALRGDVLADILTAGSPIIIVEACYVLRVYSLNHIFLTLGGTDAVGAFSVISAPANLLYQIGLGCGEVTLLLAALSHNEEDRDSLRALFGTAVPYTFLLIAAAVFAVDLSAPWIVVLFLGKAAPVHEITVMGLRLFAPSMIPTCVNCVLEKYYLGVRQKGLSVMLAVCAGAALTVPCAWAGGKMDGLRGVWIGIAVGELLTLLALSLFVWRKAGRITFSREAYCCLDADFGAAPENVLECRVRDMETAMEASERMYAFCKNALGGKGAMLISLCTEEISVNVVKHGFSANRAAHLLEVRAVRRDGRYILRFRDDCEGFDPTKYAELHQKGDSNADHIGLRMVMSMVNEATYINALGLNNLTLEITAQPTG